MSEVPVVDLMKLAEWVSGMDTPVLILLILYAGYRRVWVWGDQYKEMETERNYWRETALSVSGLPRDGVSRADEI